MSYLQVSSYHRQRSAQVSNEYKRTLQEFEDAVRAHEVMGLNPPEEHAGIQRRYDNAKRKLVGKLQYRQLAAEERVRSERT